MTPSASPSGAATAGAFTASTSTPSTSTTGASTDRAGLFARAADLIIAGKQRAAETIFRDLLSADPTDAESLHSLGLLCLAQNRAAEAAALLARAAAADPASAAIATQFGLALARLNRRTEALASLDRAIALNPNQADAHDARGTVLLAEQRAPRHSPPTTPRWRCARTSPRPWRTVAAP
jgi:predicted Zn-dependent protease